MSAADSALVSSPDTIAVVDGLVFAPFVRRVAALALDAALISVVVVLLVEVLRLAAGAWAPFEPLWRTPEVVATDGGEHRREEKMLYGGGTREIEQRWEVRRYADGSFRAFAISDSRITASDGGVVETRMESEIGRDARTLVRRWLTWGLLILLPLAYFAVFEASAWQASPGKRVLGIRIVDRNGRRIGPWRSLARQGMKLAEVVSTGLGYLLAAMTGRRQAFHDVVAGTYVVSG